LTGTFLQKIDQPICKSAELKLIQLIIFALSDRQKCDGFMIASVNTNMSIGTVDIPHEGEASYNNLWLKARSIWSYVYHNYYDKYDWFRLGNANLYLLVENLRYYLDSEEIWKAANGGLHLSHGSEKLQTPLFLGCRFSYMGKMNDTFHDGGHSGPGYTLNKAALKRLVVDGFPNDVNRHGLTYAEDTFIARLFRNYSVYPYHTEDENGSERYMPFIPGQHYSYRLLADPSRKDWYAQYSINIKEGKCAFSASFQIAFSVLHFCFLSTTR
jgi:glycoprotein-N-acetylgalactosamine 3-beta-galactosyltransferase